MKIYVIRHGATDWNIAGKLQGQENIELNDEGRKQAEEVAQLLKDKRIDIIFSSSLNRAMKTAQIINREFNVPIVSEPRLMERYLGKFQGMTKEEIKPVKEANSQLLGSWDYNADVDFWNMEIMRDFCDRVYECLDEIIAKYKDKNVLIVTHGGTSVPIKAYFMNIPLEEIKDRDRIKGLNNCEIAEFEA